MMAYQKEVVQKTKRQHFDTLFFISSILFSPSIRKNRGGGGSRSVFEIKTSICQRQIDRVVPLFFTTLLLVLPKFDRTFYDDGWWQKKKIKFNNEWRKMGQRELN